MSVTTACQTTTSVSALLKEARAAIGVSRHAAAAQTKIPERYLELFETGEFAHAADDVYSRIYLKTYCTYLKLEIAPVIALYRQERLRAIAHHRPAQVRRHPATPVNASQLIVAPNVIRNTIIAAAVLGLAAYLFLSVKNIVTPPSITLLSPQDSLVTTDSSVSVEGRTEREVNLTVNGKLIAADSQGGFRDTIDLQEGLNVIKVVGAKKHSREMTVIRRVFVQPTERPTAALPYGPDAPVSRN